ncbi:ubiquitin-conjugating enzyme E2 E2 [Alligator mississippiensis]|uniref:Ubiquitin-conjugating enzyme E2 E2 n=1 Tax=Alligator mississippiensis TaxID=8496 RepID=A0A151MQU3_ALLMI|nr:ubiquitin-conjugating enzyme E2 E2 [Alligator mississippiensis]
MPFYKELVLFLTMDKAIKTLYTYNNTGWVQSYDREQNLEYSRFRETSSHAPGTQPHVARISSYPCPESKMSAEGQRVDDSPSTSGGSSDGDQREGVQQEQEREQVQPKKKEGKISSKTAAKLSTSAKRIQKELAEITLDPPPNCRREIPV